MSPRIAAPLNPRHFSCQTGCPTCSTGRRLFERRRRLSGRAPLAPAGPDRRAAWVWTLLLAGAICFITFYAKGGLSPETMTVTEMALTCAAGDPTPILAL